MVIRVADMRNATAKGGGSYMDLDDRMLVLDFQAGNPEAFVELHRRYAGLARHICQRILGNPDDADEAAQETMLRVFQGLSRFNGRYAVQPWVARIATNVSLDITRARARRPQASDRPLDELAEEGDGSADEPSEAVERLLEVDRVKQVLSIMPEHHREALVLREFEGRSHKEIGDALGVTPPQAKALIHRAKGTFRRLWDGRDEAHRGLAAFVPFLFVDKLVGLFRKVADKATEAGQNVATTQAVTAVASSPVVPAAASQTAERVVAAATVTLIVAGGVTVGAATLTHRKAEPPARPSPVTQVIEPQSAPSVVPAVPVPTRVKPPKATRQRIAVPSGSPAPTGSPTPEPSPSASPSPEPSPSGSPSGTPPPPAPGPPPAWTGSFNVDWPSSDLCSCGPGVGLLDTNATGQVADGSALDVDQQFSGAALDGEGDPAWALQAGYGAHLETTGGHLNLTFSLASDQGTFGYGGYVSSADAVIGTPGDGNPLTYVFSGTYTIEQGDPDSSPIRTSGPFTVRLVVWGDGTTVVSAQVDLQIS